MKPKQFIVLVLLWCLFACGQDWHTLGGPGQNIRNEPGLYRLFGMVAASTGARTAEANNWIGSNDAVGQFYWSTCSTNYSAIDSGLTTVWNASAVPVMTWQTTNDCVSYQSSTSTNSLYGGGNSTYNGIISTVATHLINFVCPGSNPPSTNGTCDGTHDRRMYLRIDQEMTGDWYPWAECKNTGPAVCNANASGSFVTMWKHIHNTLSANSQLDATHVQWIWNPDNFISTANSCPQSTIQACYTEYYPGDGFVDWMTLDGYVKCGDSKTRTADNIWGPNITALRAITNKPLGVSEYGFQMGGCTDGRTLTDMNNWLGTLNSYFDSKAVKMAVYFDSSGASCSYCVISASGSGQTWGDGSVVVSGTTYNTVSGYKTMRLGDAAWLGSDSSNSLLLTTTQFQGK